MNIHLIRLLVTSALLAPQCVQGLCAQVEYRTARLDGAQEVPPVTTSGSGWGLLRIDTATNQVQLFVRTDGVPSAAMAHLHSGAAGTNGPVLIGLTQTGSEVWTGSGTLSGANAAAVLAGDTYFNVHTPAFPGGEVRGQVVESVATPFGAVLDGSQEVPPVTTNATGSLDLVLFEPDNLVVVDCSVTGMNATMAHLHRGAVGVNGPIAVALGNGPTEFCHAAEMSPSDVALLKNGDIYVNVHSAAFPGGEVRGQVLEERQFNVGLNGVESGTGSAAYGRARMVLNADNSLTYDVEVVGMNATAAHIHQGAAGQNGPVEVPFTGGGTSFVGTTAPLTSAQLALLDSESMYVNVHSAAFPAGELRGQITVDGGDLPTVYGQGCPGVGGVPVISSPGPAIAGFDVTVELYRGTASSIAGLLLGFNRDNSVAGPLPLELSAVNLPGCFLLHDNTGTGPTALIDSRGCGSASLAVPPSTSLLGLEAYGQWAVLSPGTNPLGVVLSNAVVLRIR